MIKDFKNTFQEVIVEGKRQKTFAVHYTKPSSVHYTDMSSDDLPEDRYTEEEMEMLYMGTSSEARKRFQRSRSFQQRQPFDKRRSCSQDSNFPPRRPRYDGVDRRDRS